jgi:tRNA 2-selenouridine synthase
VVLFEDESRLIGRIAVLPEFLARTKEAPIIHLKATFEERVQRIRKDYFVNAYKQQLPNGEEYALDYLDNFIRLALNRIQKRLGGKRHKLLLTLLDDSLALLKSTGRWSRFDSLIEVLLNDYYDPMYNYQYAKKTHQQIMEGDHSEVLQWLAMQLSN